MLKKLLGRQARPATPAWNLAKTLMQTAVFWSVFLFVLPAIVYHLETSLGLKSWRCESSLGKLLGGLLFTLGGCLGLISGAVMAIKGRGTPLPIDCPRVMVVAGPYRFVRNPMAIAGLSQGVAVGIFLGSPAVVLYALCGGPVWNYLVRPAEEQDLAERFGESFLAYQSAVRCWWPRLRPYLADANPTRAEGE